MSAFSKPINTKYIFIDMNSYFASCEQQNDPSIKDLPVAVAAINCHSGCILSASYEAKRLGIKTGTIVSEAKKMCPRVIIREANTYLYLTYHKRIVNVLESFSPFIVVKSIDEAYIKLSPSEQSSHTAIKIAKSLKSAIITQIGSSMKSSIGIGPNIFLSKQGSDYQKPDGLTEIRLESLEEYYKKIELMDIKGINVGMRNQLYLTGIYNPLDFYRSSIQSLRTKLGRMGEYWYMKLHGYDVVEAPIANPKSIGHSHVLPPNFRNWDLAWSVCQKLIEKVGYRLRNSSLQASEIYISVRFLAGGGWKKHMRVNYFSDNFTFMKIIYHLWKKIPARYNFPFKISLSVFGLKKVEAREQRLFYSCKKEEDLSEAIDNINDKYGSFTVKPASIMKAESTAPDRIAFGNLKHLF